jgi:ParB family transcriptional regulator, chromosome partitioning protein
VKGLVTSGDLSAGHLRAILNAPDPKQLAERIVAGGLSVRQAEALASEAKAETPKARPRDKKGDKDADTKALERALSEALGLKVEINHRGASGGKVEVSYRSLEQLDEVCRRLQAG